MTEYCSAALFVYTDEGGAFLQSVQDNPYGVAITPVELENFLADPEGALEGFDHILVSGDLAAIRGVMGVAARKGCSLGILALPTQKELIRTYWLPAKPEDAIELALRCDPPPIDLVRCNGITVLHRAILGRLPLLDAAQDTGRWDMILQAVRKFVGLKLLPFRFSTDGGKRVKTAACGCLMVPHPTGNRAVRKVLRFARVGDGAVNLIVSAPSSIVRYLHFLWQILLAFAGQPKSLPTTLGHLKSPTVTIESDTELMVDIDSDAKTQLPARFEAVRQAVAVNVGDRFREEMTTSSQGEKVSVKDLPKGKEELAKAARKNIPFFSYASEERFRDLFVALRQDAETNSTYLVLMMLSTLLATIGLYQDSAAVVIGAMLLAPLMAPIISLAMGVVRLDRNLSRRSVKKIVVGVLLALLAAALVTLLFPHKPITEEMSGRLNPSLLDLGVAIVAGIAGAYTKAYKEILQSLAGVAIAVALVPPLAVAGIGLGRLDPHFFYQAFLLFSTNLVGITLAGAVTFRVLGYAPAVRDKRSLWAVTLALVIISVPLYLSYARIVEDNVLEKMWQKERFLVNGKYLIVNDAQLARHGDKEVMTMRILAREVITRSDLTLLRKKVEANFERKLFLNAEIIYIP